MVDFYFPVDHWVKMKESENIENTWILLEN